MPPAIPITGILHYTASPVIGGVEAVIDAHLQIFAQDDYPVSVVAGQGSEEALPQGSRLELIPEVDSQHPDILHASAILERGDVPGNFDALTARLKDTLAPIVSRFDILIVHNVFTKHFNLPLTAAIFELLGSGAIRNCIAWHHDFTWTSPRSRSKVYPGFPWDLLRTFRPDVTQVTISQNRRKELAGLYHCPEEAIRVIYNGVNAEELLGLSPEGRQLVQRLELLASDLVLLMPVRVTRAKNIEHALDVAAMLKAERIKVKLILTGPPDPHDRNSMAYFRSLQKLRDDMGLEEEMRFVFESGPDPGEPYFISQDVVADLYRVADLMFMPSHQEGFGMPVVEAGLLGVPVVVANTVPAADEIGDGDVLRFALDMPPDQLARKLLEKVQLDDRLRLTRRTRQNFTWQTIFQRDIEPLLHGINSP